MILNLNLIPNPQEKEREFIRREFIRILKREREREREFIRIQKRAREKGSIRILKSERQKERD